MLYVGVNMSCFWVEVDDCYIFFVSCYKLCLFSV